MKTKGKIESMTITIEGSTAYIARSSRAQDGGKWIICACDSVRGLIESDDLGARHGLFTSRKAAISAFGSSAKAWMAR